MTQIKIKPMSEKEIQKSIIQYLESQENQGKLYFFRSGSGAIKTEKGGFFKSGKPGCPDISVVLPTGFFLGIEVKTEKGKLSPAQKLTSEKLNKLGAGYCVVRSLDEFKKDLETCLKL